MIFRLKDVRETEADGGIVFVHSFVLDKAQGTDKAAIFEVASSIRLPWTVTKRYEVSPVEVKNESPSELKQ